MNTKKITATLLLLFVVVSVGTIVAKETGVQTSDIVKPQEQIVAQQETMKRQEPISSVKVIAYYFHGNVRCVTCRKIEELTTEAIQGGFAKEIKDGRVELRIVNVEEPDNEHFVQDYQLASRSVVIARYDGQEQKGWKRLDEVWQLVRDKDAFIRFVQEQTANLLKGQS